MINVVESATAVNPFISNIPEERHDEYFREYLEEAKKLAEVEIDRNKTTNEETIHLRYKLFVIFASKHL